VAHRRSRPSVKHGANFFMYTLFIVTGQQPCSDDNACCLCSYEAKFTELDAKNQQFQEEFRQKSNDQHDTVTLYTKTLEQRGSYLWSSLLLLSHNKTFVYGVMHRQLQQNHRSLMWLKTPYYFVENCNKNTTKQVYSRHCSIGVGLAYTHCVKFNRRCVGHMSEPSSANQPGGVCILVLRGGCTLSGVDDCIAS